MAQPWNLFTHLHNLTKNKIFPDFSLDEVHKSYDLYMVNRYMSMYDAFLPIIELANQYNLDKKTHYALLFNLLPQESLSFNNYIKKKKNEVLEEEKELLMKYFQFGKNDLEVAMGLLEKSQIDCIILKYKNVGKVK